EYEFSPGPRELLDELLPAVVRLRLFQAWSDAAVSEQVARMVAMKAATDAAGDMIKALGRQYNRARQTQITMELLDIVGGANALNA
nr:F0F1 ATP synthase subunit gamma [Acidobacteriota bacterium]